MMGYGRSDGFYPPGVPALNVWNTLAPATPSKLIEAEITRTYFNIRPGLLSPIVVELVVNFKQDVKIDSLKLGQFERGGAKKWFIRTSSGEILSSDKNPDALSQWRKIELDKEGYIAFCGSPMGSVAVFNLGDQALDVYAQKDSGIWEIRFPLEGKELKGGSKVSAKLLVVGTPFTVEPDERWIEEVRGTMGLAGKPGYQLVVEKGKVISNRYILTIDGGEEGFVGKFKRADLLVALPIMVKGLNERWSVYLLERDKGVARPIGQFKDCAYATIDLRERDKEIFIGHPIICSDREVYINVVQTGDREFSAYIHNPTKKPKDIILRSNPQWTLGKVSAQRMVLQPGESKLVKF